MARVCVIKFFNPVQGQPNIRVFAERFPLAKGYTHAVALTCDFCNRQFISYFNANGLVSTKTLNSCTHTGRTHGILSGNLPAIGAIKFYPETLDFCQNIKAKVAVHVAANASIAPKAKPGAIPPLPTAMPVPVAAKVAPPAPSPAPIAQKPVSIVPVTATEAFGGKSMDRFALIELW